MSLKSILIGLIIALMLLNGCKNEKPNETGEKVDMFALISAKIKKDPKNSDLYYQQAKLYFQNDRLNDAFLSCKQAISLKDNVAEYYLLQADIFLKQGKTDESFSSVEKAIALESNNIKANLKLAELCLFLKNYDRALELTKKVMDLDKLNPTAYSIAGYTLKEMGDTATAVKYFKKVVELDPENAQAFEELGILFALRKDKIAVDYLNSAININPKNTMALYALALYYQEQDMIEEAASLYGNILTISPAHANALHNLGYIELVYNENYPKAIEYFTQVINIDPQYTEAYYNRGFSYEKMQKRQDAIADYEKALNLNPNHKKAEMGLKRLGKDKK